MDRVVVDTDVLIDFFAGVSPAAETIARLLEEDRLTITALTVFELACGAQKEEQLRDLELLIQAAQLLPLDGAAALHAGAIYRELRAKGQVLDIPDLLIAGCCLAAGLPLFTRDTGHFGRVKNLKVLSAEEILKS